MLKRAIAASRGNRGEWWAADQPQVGMLQKQRIICPRPSVQLSLLSQHVHGGRRGLLKDEQCFVEGNAGEKEKRRKEKKCDVLQILSVVSLAASTPSLFFARELSPGQQQAGQSVKVVAGIVFDLQAAALSLLDNPDLGVQLVGQLVGQGGTV